ncbi:unnamed protein product [Pleuronectes platessa]|uniref:Uncharacterized protein n=1 Tax=Pleuronectes platessa TaxID=8262 RepID=A0A9N7UEB7_PLEPL|nr:unnamed protein product [Pleuronectes platessa]
MDGVTRGETETLVCEDGRTIGCRQDGIKRRGVSELRDYIHVWGGGTGDVIMRRGVPRCTWRLLPHQGQDILFMVTLSRSTRASASCDRADFSVHPAAAASLTE